MGVFTGGECWGRGELRAVGRVQERRGWVLQGEGITPSWHPTVITHLSGWTGGNWRPEQEPSCLLLPPHHAWSWLSLAVRPAHPLPSSLLHSLTQSSEEMPLCVLVMRFSHTQPYLPSQTEGEESRWEERNPNTTQLSLIYRSPHPNRSEAQAQVLGTGKRTTDIWCYILSWIIFNWTFSTNDSTTQAIPLVILICWFDAHKKFIIIYVENSCAA